MSEMFWNCGFVDCMLAMILGLVYVRQWVLEKRMYELEKIFNDMFSRVFEVSVRHEVFRNLKEAKQAAEREREPGEGGNAGCQEM